jgi:hypothetical protein
MNDDRLKKLVRASGQRVRTKARTGKIVRPTADQLREMARLLKGIDMPPREWGKLASPPTSPAPS